MLHLLGEEVDLEVEELFDVERYRVCGFAGFFAAVALGLREWLLRLSPQRSPETPAGLHSVQCTLSTRRDFFRVSLCCNTATLQ